MRFLADENVSRILIDNLRSRGLEVIAVAESRPGASDKDIIEAAHTQQCIVITEDRDFGELVIRQRLAVAGLILLELDRLSNAVEAQTVADFISTHVDRLVGNLVVLEPGRIRIRPLSP